MEVGEKVKSDIPPHGGSWIRNEETGELELIEPPTGTPGAPEPKVEDDAEEKEKKE